MPTKTLTAQHCNESWATRKTLRCLAAAETASQRREGGLIVSRADPRGSSPTGS
jgi:hypothetical protein